MRSQSLFTKMSVGIMVFAIAQTASADLSTGLVAHYLFSGNAKDASGNGHDGTVYGATPTSDRFGNSNGAYSFDGRDDYVRVPDHPQLEGMSAVTLSLWVRMDSIDRMTEVLNKWVAGDSPLNGVYNMGIDTGGQAAFQYCTGDAYVIKISEIALGIGSWHHIVGVYTGAEGSIYIDGSLAALSRDDPDSSGPLHAITDDLLIGCGNLRGDLIHFFDGSIDDVRIYSRALSPGEIEDLRVVPVPGAALLGVLGLGYAGLRLRRCSH